MTSFYNGQPVLVLGQDVGAIFENKFKGFGQDGVRISTTRDVHGTRKKFYSFVPAEWVSIIDDSDVTHRPDRDGYIYT